MVNYLKISEVRSAKINNNAKPRLNRDCYTKMSGSPTQYMVRLVSTGRWHRVYEFCISNCPSFHIKTKDGNRAVSDYMLHEIKDMIKDGIDTKTEAMIQDWDSINVSYSTDGKYRPIDK